MKKLKSNFFIGCVASSLLLAGCGGGSSSNAGGGNNPPPASGTEISGTASAPGGSVAMLGEKNTFLLAVKDFMFTPVHAAITGLDPVEGATVELILVDDDGTQVGDVLASTTTSISGDYTLTVPAGTDLAGNLIVRITGTGGIEMRAQVVDQDVDISPVSEFVLQKFIDEDADLDNLTTASVIKLSGQVEAFDLTAGADLDEMLALLEEETGDFVEAQISVISSTPGDAATLAGNYRGVDIEFGLHDDDQQYGVGTLSLDGGIFEFSLTDEGDGHVELTLNLEEGFYSNQTFLNNVNNTSTTLSYDVEVETGSGETETAQIDDAGILSLETDFEEEVDGDFGWRWPASIERLQKAQNTNIFFGTKTDAGVRYQTTDTNNDGENDAVDPAAREGDEVFKGLTVIAQQPTTMTTADLSGDFGRVYIETELGSNGFYNSRVEHNILSFDGAGSLDITAATIFDLQRTASELSYIESSDTAEAGIPYSISDNGSTLTVGGESQDSLFNDSVDFLVVSDVSSVDDANPDDNQVNEVQSGTTYAVKLPNAQLDISNKVYRVFFIGISLTQNGTALASESFDTQLTVNSDGVSGAIISELHEIEKANPTAEVEAFNEEPISLDTTITLAANGQTTMVVGDQEGSFTLNGFLSHDGSLGIFHSRYADVGEDPDELGLVILVEVTAPAN